MINFRRKYFLVLLVIILILLISPKKKPKSTQIVATFYELENILDQEINSDENIFFIETSGGNSVASLNSRQACSVESTALTNPNSKVFLIFSEKTSMEDSMLFEALRKYENIFFLKIEIDEFSKGTIVESWVASKKIYKSKFVKENMSDLLRFLLLWRFNFNFLLISIR